MVLAFYPEWNQRMKFRQLKSVQRDSEFQVESEDEHANGYADVESDEDTFATHTARRQITSRGTHADVPLPHVVLVL